MRWSYLIPRLLIVSFIWTFLVWGKDPLLKYSAVESVQAVTGAKADISELSTSLYPPRLMIDQVALASADRPGTNLMQFDQLEFRMDGRSLLRRQFVIEEGRLTGVRFRTIRDDDGQLAAKPKPQPDNGQPSWIREQLQQMGKDWLNDLVEQGKAQLDPNRLETYRTGSEIYTRWDGRFNQLSDRAKLLKPRFEQLKLQFDQARRGDPLQMIEQYLQVAHRAEQLTRDAQQLRDELLSISPEVKTDFARLDQARKNDQRLVVQTIDLLKPDSRRVTEALIGEQMYLQLQQLLSWIDLAGQYRQELAEQTRPKRQRGTEFRFPWLDPSPNFHIRRLLISGTVNMDGDAVPFEAELADVTENAPLLGRPCVFRIQTDGPVPLTLNVTYDARRQIPVTHLAASWRDAEGHRISSGNPDSAMFSARLADVRWNMSLTIVQRQLAGTFRLQSQLGDAMFVASESIRPEFLTAARDAIRAIDRVDATLALSGTVLKPVVSVQSDLGRLIVDGVQLAFLNQIQDARQRLMSDVNAYASDQVSRLTSRFATEYQTLKDDNAQLISQVQQVHTVASAMRTGQVDVNTLFRTASDSKLIPNSTRSAPPSVPQFSGFGQFLQQAAGSGFPQSPSGSVPQ